MNMHETGNRRPRRAAWLALLLAGGWAAASPAAYVITTDDRQIDGTGISAKENGEIALKIAQGERIFLPGQYKRAVADEPPEYNQAQQLIAGKKYDQAVELLNNLVIKYKWLDWDIKAVQLIAEADIRQGNPAAAVKNCEQIMVTYPRLKEDAAFQAQYRVALIGAKQFTRVEPMLSAAISTGNRANAARAQLQRGDLPQPRQRGRGIEDRVEPQARAVPDLHPGQPSRRTRLQVLHEERGLLDALRPPFTGRRPPHQVREHGGRGCGVIADHIELRRARRRVEHPLRAGHLELLTSDGEQRVVSHGRPACCSPRQCCPPLGVPAHR